MYNDDYEERKYALTSTRCVGVTGSRGPKAAFRLAAHRPYSCTYNHEGKCSNAAITDQDKHWKLDITTHEATRCRAYEVKHSCYSLGLRQASSAVMATKYAFTTGLRELRFHLCPSGSGSDATRSDCCT